MNRKLAVAVAVAASFAALSTQAALPTYVGTAITSAQSDLTDLIAVMVTAAIAITMLALTPRVLIKMIRGLGSKVSF